MSTPGVLVELVDLDPDNARAAWAEWYDRTYLVERAGLEGVLAARRATRATGSVQNFVEPVHETRGGPAVRRDPPRRLADHDEDVA